MFERLAELIEKHPVVAIADLQKVRSSQIQEIRKKLRGQAEVLVAKNTILKKAAGGLGEKKPNIGKFTDELAGSNLLLFTGMNPYALILFLNRNKVRVPAKAGDIATSEIIIPAGNTGLQPGPVISEFGEVKVTTRIEGGSIWVAKDTVVAEKGDTISPKLASLLSKLGMKPMEAGLSIVRAFDEGTVLRPEDLVFDLESYQNDLADAYRDALALAAEAEYVVPETASSIMANAYREALYLANEVEFPTSENIEDLVKRAYVEMKILSDAAAQINSEAAAQEEEVPAAPALEAKPQEVEPPGEKPAEERPAEAKAPVEKPQPVKPPEEKKLEKPPAAKPPETKPPEKKAPPAKPPEKKPAKERPAEKKRQEKVEKKAKR